MELHGTHFNPLSHPIPFYKSVLEHPILDKLNTDLVFDKEFDPKTIIRLYEMLQNDGKVSGKKVEWINATAFGESYIII